MHGTAMSPSSPSGAATTVGSVQPVSDSRDADQRPDGERVREGPRQQSPPRAPRRAASASRNPERQRLQHEQLQQQGRRHERGVAQDVARHRDAEVAGVDV